MANKKTRVTYGGMNKDISKSKFANNLYYDANNMKLTPVEGQTFGSISNAYGNKLVLELPIPSIDTDLKVITAGTSSLSYTNAEVDVMPASGVQVIIGHAITKNGFILFSTDNSGFDCIWEIPDVEADPLTYELLYCRNLEFSSDYPIQAIYNYENSKIQKIFWVDGKNYLRFVNIAESIANGFESDLIDLQASSVNSRSSFNASQPTVSTAAGGGTHTAGVIQYAYSLYNLNGSETTTSPYSLLFPLDKGESLGGGDVNEVVGATPIVVIEDIDPQYDFLKLYSIKYTEYNATPEINLIYDGGIGNYASFSFSDTGNKSLASLGVAEFIFLGADAVKPQHIAAKDNILFIANNTSTEYQLDVDCRAYSYNSAGNIALIYDNVIYDEGALVYSDIPYTGDPINVATAGFDAVDEDFDCVNLDYDTYRYTQAASGTAGTVILNAADYNESLVADNTEIHFEDESGSTVSSTTVVCDANNNTPQYKLFPITPPSIPISTGNDLTVTNTGDYFISIDVNVDLPLTSVGIQPSSLDVIVTKTDLLLAETEIFLNRTIDLNQFPNSISADTFSGVIPLLAGETIRVDVRFGYHFNNNYCSTQAINPFTSEPYDQDPEDPFNEPVTPVVDDVTMFYSGYEFSQGTVVNNLDLPLTENFGENMINGNGEIVSNYSGNLLVEVNSEAITNILLTNPLLFSIGLYKNSSLYSSSQLNLSDLGTNTQSVLFNLNVNVGDILSFKAIPVTNEYNFTKENYNVDFIGDVTLTETISDGSSGEGGTGKNIIYELTRTPENDVNTKLDRFFKDNEIYRIGIVFRNSLGQESEAKWIADFKAPEGNLIGQYNTLKVTLTSEFYSYINTLSEEERPVNYSIVRAVRTENDKTIINQGIITGMMSQLQSTTIARGYMTEEERIEANLTSLKNPVPFTRGYGDGEIPPYAYWPTYPTKHLKTMNRDYDRGVFGGAIVGREMGGSEIYDDNDNDFNIQKAWQYTKLMQMHSPEATFQFPINVTNTDELVVLGYMKRDLFEYKEQETHSETFVVEDTTYESFPNGTAGDFYYPTHLPGGFGLIGPCYRYYTSSGGGSGPISKLSRQLHTHKTFYPLVRNEQTYEIYGTPEVTELGQAPVFYNNDPTLKYDNRLTTLITDTYKNTHDRNFTNEDGASSIDSEGNRCITFALGDETITDTENRTGLEDLWSNTGVTYLDWDSEVFGEIRRSKEYVYSGTLYGGYDNYARANTEYVGMGVIEDIDTDEVEITSPGDTFVQVFKNTRMTKVPGSVYNKTNPVVCETLDYLVETVVNLEERSDLSIKSWGTIVDPVAEEANKYNRVYSTDSTIKIYYTDNIKINVIKQLETQVQASKVKVPAEFVESWVDFRPNEVINLDGRYGPINALVSQWDELYTFQDTGVAKLSINPRVQVQANDGVALELGTGSTLQDYFYISTKTGSVNKWGITSANTGIYYIDATTKQMYRVEDSKVAGASETKGMHTYFYNNLDKSRLSEDNPITRQGISMGYDNINGDVYTTVMDEENLSYTVSFNEKMNAFTSFYDFKPSTYITRGDKMFTTSEDNTELWLHYDGNYQEYYCRKHPADITILVNTDEVNAEKIFNSIEFDSEVTIDGDDVHDVTIDTIQGWNDYQESNEIRLIVGENLRRRMRTWKASIPRQKASRARLRDKWLYLKVGFNPEDNYKLVLHDIIINYSSQ